MSNGRSGNKKATIEDLAAHLKAVEAKVDQLTGLIQALTHRHTASFGGDRLLIGWGAISRYCGKSPSTLMRYRRRMALPIFRWGRHAYAVPSFIAAWLGVVDSEKQKLREIYGAQEEKKHTSAPSRRVHPKE